MSSLSLRRPMTTFEARAASRPLDTASRHKTSYFSPDTLQPVQAALAERLRELHGCSCIELHSQPAAALEAAANLARQWGRGKRRTAGTLLRVDEQPGNLPVNDYEALAAAIDSGTVAVVIQLCATTGAELTESYLKRAERLCRSLHILLIIDQSRTETRLGSALAERPYGVQADVIVSRYGTALAAVLIRTCTDGLAAVASDAWHASPGVCAAALSVLDKDHLPQLKRDSEPRYKGLGRLLGLVR